MELFYIRPFFEKNSSVLAKRTVLFWKKYYSFSHFSKRTIPFLRGTILFFDGTILFSDGTIIFSHGTILLFDGTILFSDGTVLFSVFLYRTVLF